jgi:hypothetical protein
MLTLILRLKYGAVVRQAQRRVCVSLCECVCVYVYAGVWTSLGTVAVRKKEQPAKVFVIMTCGFH